MSAPPSYSCHLPLTLNDFTYEIYIIYGFHIAITFIVLALVTTVWYRQTVHTAHVETLETTTAKLNSLIDSLDSRGRRTFQNPLLLSVV